MSALHVGFEFEGLHLELLSIADIAKPKVVALVPVQTVLCVIVVIGPLEQRFSLHSHV